MKLGYTPNELLGFEEEIAQLFIKGEIRSPIHLGGGNERALIDIFDAHVKPDDWVLCGWRSHYHCLLKGVPWTELTRAIVNGQSVSLCFPKQKVLCSGIVGGIAPIAVGLAMAKGRRVHCFLGDMSAESGIFHECSKYAARHDLPIHWVIEDNGLSVCTETQDSWGAHVNGQPNVTRYKYKLTRPHCGIGEWVKF